MRNTSQNALFIGYQHADFKGRQDKVDKMGLINAPYNFYDDDLIGVSVKDGYYADVYEHPDGKGQFVRVIGQVANLDQTVSPDRGRWKDRISSIQVGTLPAGYQNAAKNFREGIYRIYNPYKNTFLRAGKGAGTDAAVITENEDFSLSSTKLPSNYDDTYKFVVVKGIKNRFYIFSLASGKGLIPQNAGMEIKPNTVVSSINFSDGLQGEKLRLATYQLKPIGFNRFSIVCNSNPDIAITMAKLPWQPENLTYEVHTKEAAQQFEFILDTAFPENVSFSPEVIKDNERPDSKDMVDIEYANNKSTPYKVFKTKIPFYMVKDEEIRLKDRIQKSPFYTLLREEFAQRKGGSDIDGWLYNKTSSEMKDTRTFSTTTTSGSSSESSTDIGLSQSLSVMVSDGFFSEVESTTTFSTNLGFSTSEYKEFSSTHERSIELPIPPCSKGATFGIGNRITLKRQDNTIVKQFEVFSPDSLNNMAITLHPDECPTIRAKGQQAYDDALAAYYADEYNKAKGITPDSDKAGSGDSSSNSDKALNLDPNKAYFITSKAHPDQVWDVYNPANEGKVGLWKRHGGDNQKFKIAEIGEGYHIITNAITGQAIDYWYDHVQNYEKHGGEQQQVKIVPSSTAGYFYFQSRRHSETAITGMPNQEMMQEHKVEHKDAQLYKFVPLD